MSYDTLSLFFSNLSYIPALGKAGRHALKKTQAVQEGSVSLTVFLYRRVDALWQREREINWHFCDSTICDEREPALDLTCSHLPDV